MLGLRSKSQNFFKSIQNYNNRIAEGGNNALIKLENRVQGTFMEKWLKYWKSLCKDYQDVARDVCLDVKQKPVKAMFIGSSCGSLYYLAKHNPDEQNFRDAYLRAANDILLVHPSLQRSESAEHLCYIEKKFNSNCIRRFSFIIGSVIWLDRYSEDCNVYEAQCTYLQVQWRKFKNRILDVGFLDTWWILRNKMVDYDVNY